MLEVLQDYIAFARTYVHLKLSEEAGQALVQAYSYACRYVCINNLYYYVVIMEEPPEIPYIHCQKLMLII